MENNIRYIKFVMAYFYGPPGVVGNALQAAIKAGYSEKTADKKSFGWVGNSRENASNKALWDLVQEERQKLEQELGVTREMIVAAYKRCGFLNPKAFFHPDGTFKEIHELEDDVAAAIAGMDVATKTFDEDGKKVVQRIIKIKFVDKKGVLDSLCRIKGMFIDRQEHTGKNGGPIEHQWTNFPKEPETIAEFERQCREADAAREDQKKVISPQPFSR